VDNLSEFLDVQEIETNQDNVIDFGPEQPPISDAFSEQTLGSTTPLINLHHLTRVRLIMWFLIFAPKFRARPLTLGAP